MCKCNESNNCSNSGKSFGEGNANARAELHHNGTNRNGRNYKDSTMRKEVNNMGKTNENNNSNTGNNNKDNALKSFEEFLMTSHISPLHFLLNNKETNNDSIFNGKCPMFDEGREKCKNCNTFNNKNVSDTSDTGEKEEVPDFIKFLMSAFSEELERAVEEIEEEKDQDESSDDLKLFKDGKKIPLGEVLAHLANTVDSIQTTVDKMSEMHDGILLEAEPIMMEGFNNNESFNKIGRKLSKMNRRIQDLDAKIEVMPNIIVSTLIQRLKEADELDAKNKNKK